MFPKKFKKRPVVIEAMRFDASHSAMTEVARW